MSDFTKSRISMVDCQVRPSDVTKFPVIEAMLAVRREVFVPGNMRDVAYAGTHLPLGRGRVVADPRVLAKTLDALDIGKSDLVMESRLWSWLFNGRGRAYRRGRDRR